MTGGIVELDLHGMNTYYNIFGQGSQAASPASFPSRA